MINLSFSLSPGLSMTEEDNDAIRRVTDQDARVVAKLFKYQPATPIVRSVPTLERILADEPTKMVFARLDFDWDAWQATFSRTSPPEGFVAPVIQIDEATLLRVASFTALCDQVEYKVFLRVSRSDDRRLLTVSDYDVVPLQEVTGVRVRHTHNRERLASMLAYRRRTSAEDVLESLKGDLHSHVSMDAVPSDLDLRETFSFASGLGSREAQTPTIWWLAIIVNRHGEFYTYYVDLEQGVMVVNLKWSVINPLPSDEARIALAKDALPNALRELRQNVASGLAPSTRPVSKAVPLPPGGEQATALEWSDTAGDVISSLPPQQMAQAPAEEVEASPEGPVSLPKPEEVSRANPGPVRNGKRLSLSWLAASAVSLLLLFGLAASLGLWDKKPAPEPAVAVAPVVHPVMIVATAPAKAPPAPKLEQTPTPIADTLKPEGSAPAVPSAVPPPAPAVADRGTPAVLATEAQTQPAPGAEQPAPPPVAEAAPPAQAPAKDERTEPVAQPVAVSAPVPVAAQPSLPVRTKAEELKERFTGVVRPERIWPDPRKFDRVSTKTLELFGGMTIFEFWDWCEANPEARRKVPPAIQDAFDHGARASKMDGDCQQCLSDSPPASCDGYRNSLELGAACKDGALFLGLNEMPLRKVLEERRKKAR